MRLEAARAILDLDRVVGEDVPLEGRLAREHHLQLAILGPDAQIAMPDREERRRLVARAVSRKAGPEGANAKDGTFAWKKLLADAEQLRNDAPAREKVSSQALQR